MKPTPNQIKQIFDDCGTDKGSYHNYHHFYSWVAECIPRPISILEIGVLEGSSLLAWTRIFPEIYLVRGIDIDISRVRRQDVLNHPQINIIKADATKEMWEGPYDIVIDDASHRAEDQIAAYKLYAPQTTRMYIIEDVTVWSMNRLGGDWRIARTGNHYDDRILFKVFYDRPMIVRASEPTT